MGAQNRGPELLGVNLAFGIIAGIAVILRCYTRVFIVRSFGGDDWLMLTSTIIFLAYIISSNLGIHYGTGQHKSDLAPEDFRRAMQYWWCCYLFFSVSMVTSKLSFAWFLLRIVTNRLHAWIIYLASMCTVIGGVAFFFVTMLQCQPVSHYWDKTGKGKCISMDIIIALGYLYSAFSVITDFTYAVLPGFLIWNLNMKKRARCMLIFLIVMGCAASSAVVIRIPYIKTFKDPDFLYATTDIAIWSTVEMGLAISAASLSTLRPLAKLVGCKLGLSSNRTSPSNMYGGSLGAANAVGGDRRSRGNNFGNHVYIHSEVSQDHKKTNGKSWILGTQVTAYAGSVEMDASETGSEANLHPVESVEGRLPGCYLP